MIHTLRLSLASLCAGLLVIIVAEFFLPVTGQTVSPAQAPSTARINTSAPALDAETLVAAILERPLFNPTRRPPQMAPASAQISKKTPESFHARLAGVTNHPGSREALFVIAGQKPIAAKVGSEVDGWKITAIEADRVILSSAFGSQVVKPTNAPYVARAPGKTVAPILAAAQPAASPASAAVGENNPNNRAGPLGVQATPNLMRDPALLVARTARQRPKS